MSSFYRLSLSLSHSCLCPVRLTSIRKSPHCSKQNHALKWRDISGSNPIPKKTEKTTLAPFARARGSLVSWVSNLRRCQETLEGNAKNQREQLQFWGRPRISSSLDLMLGSRPALTTARCRGVHSGLRRATRRQSHRSRRPADRRTRARQTRRFDRYMYVYTYVPGSSPLPLPHPWLWYPPPSSGEFVAGVG